MNFNVYPYGNIYWMVKALLTQNDSFIQAKLSAPQGPP